jgi:hypothetical protein
MTLRPHLTEREKHIYYPHILYGKKSKARDSEMLRDILAKSTNNIFALNPTGTMSI